MDPRTGEAITCVSEAQKEDVDLAVKAARAAFNHGPWPRMSGSVSEYVFHHEKKVCSLSDSIVLPL